MDTRVHTFLTGCGGGGTVRGMRVRWVVAIVGGAALLTACKRESGGPRVEATATPAASAAAATPEDLAAAWQAQQTEIREKTKVEIKTACRRPAIAEPGDWVAVDADFVALPGVRLDPDDFVTVDAAAGKTVGNAAFPIALAKDGSRGSWEDPELLAAKRLRVLFLFSGVPASVKNARLGYQEVVLAEPAKIDASCPARIHAAIAAEFAQQ